MMNEHQRRLWRSMIDLIDSYLRDENTDFCSIVGGLEGALDASGITDSELLNQWYDFWTPLEIHRAVDGNMVDRSQAIKKFTLMKSFLLKYLDSSHGQ